MKKPISEQDAASIVVQAILKQADQRWDEIWAPLVRVLAAAGLQPGEKEYVKFNFSLAALAVNMRSAFDQFEQTRAERFFTVTLKILKHFFGDGREFNAIQTAIVKYIDAYNQGVLAIKNPVRHVAMLLYYKIGLRNTEQQIVDERFFAPEPNVVEYMGSSLMMFAGKWEAMDQHFEFQAPA